MFPLMFGLTFCGLKRFEDGRLCTQVRGHGFVAGASAIGFDPQPPEAKLPRDTPIWSHPQAAVIDTRCRLRAQPRRVRISWMELDLSAGLALTAEQQERWRVAGPRPVTVAEVVSVLAEAEFDALVLPAERLGVRGLGYDRSAFSGVRANDGSGANEASVAGFEPYAVMQGIIVSPDRVTHDTARVVESYEVVGEIADLSPSRLNTYPALLRQRYASDKEAAQLASATGPRA
jgi:hypothetical protein